MCTTLSEMAFTPKRSFVVSEVLRLVSTGVNGFVICSVALGVLKELCGLGGFEGLLSGKGCCSAEEDDKEGADRK